MKSLVIKGKTQSPYCLKACYLFSEQHVIQGIDLKLQSVNTPVMLVCMKLHFFLQLDKHSSGLLSSYETSLNGVEHGECEQLCKMSCSVCAKAIAMFVTYCSLVCLLFQRRLTHTAGRIFTLNFSSFE